MKFVGPNYVVSVLVVWCYRNSETLVVCLWCPMLHDSCKSSMMYMCWPIITPTFVAVQ
ncbi:Gamma-soluble NSF attachment protein [Zea mays]|uniref:Gamma-soluble NSF attachment protein n=1 Tax=Zea mays TaxID=4577 RepID=A0A1D6JEI9_MAIZE|nr:Gamma-soluble NSF attachment protein [Zea mays]